MKKLYRSNSDRMIAGVCGGLGEYFSIDPVLIRALFVLLAFMGGFGVVLYILLSFITPEEGDSAAQPRDTVGVEGEGGPAIIQDPPIHLPKTPDRRWIFGVVIIVVGAFLLLNNLAPLYSWIWVYGLPFIIIFLGVALLFKVRPKK